MTATSTVPVPSAPSVVTLELLTRARLLLEHAISHAKSPSGIDPLIAIHGLDNAVEYTIRIVADHLEYDVASGNVFPESELAAMAGELNKFLLHHYRKRLPYYRDIKTLRKVRNLVQHGAFNPSTDLKRFVTIADRFFSKMVKIIFDLEPEQLRISKIVNQPEISAFLEEAERAMDVGHHLEAVVACRDAFDNAIFHLTKSSEVSPFAAPAISHICAEDKDTPFFFESISDTLAAARLGLDSFEHYRFNHIIQHIPSEQNAEEWGHLVMQRDWSEADASFCYGFATRNILRWQAKELEPLYSLEQSGTKYRFVEFIDGTKIYRESGAGCTFHRDDGKIELMYLGREDRDYVKTLTLSTNYEIRTDQYQDDELELQIVYCATLKHRRIRLATHRPERWEVTIALRQVPFTWVSRDLKHGQVMKESPSINTSSSKELQTLYIIDDQIAKKIIAYREAVGKINSIADLEKIEGISPEQVRWLSKFTRL